MEPLKMSRGKTVPSTRKHSRSSPSGRSELIVRKKDEKQSAKKRTVLDNHFYRTDLAGERRLAVDDDVGAEALVRLIAEAFHLHDVGRLLKPSVLGAVVDDALRGLHPDPREQRELRGVGGVDVDDPGGRAGGRRRLGRKSSRTDGGDEKCCRESGEGLSHGLFLLSFCWLLCLLSDRLAGSPHEDLRSRSSPFHVVALVSHHLLFEAVHSSIGRPRGTRREVVEGIAVRREAASACCQKILPTLEQKSGGGSDGLRPIFHGQRAKADQHVALGVTGIRRDEKP